MLWFLAAGAGLFWAFWKTTAPTESEYRDALARARADADDAPAAREADQPRDALRGDDVDDDSERDIPLVEHANAESIGENRYDPDSNPFKAASKKSANGDRPRGSLDDIVDEDAPLEDYLQLGGDEEDEDADGI